MIGGITNAHIARTVRSARHTDANALYAYMTTLGNMLLKNERGKTAGSGSKSDRTASTLRHGQSQAADKKRTVTDDKTTDDKTTDEKITSNDKPQIECYNCCKIGRIARKCRKPRVECERCKRLGYSSNKCPLQKDVNVTQELGSGKNLYERAVFVNQNKVTGLIDSGSMCTLLRESVADRCNIKVLSAPNIEEFHRSRGTRLVLGQGAGGERGEGGGMTLRGTGALRRR